MTFPEEGIAGKQSETSLQIRCVKWFREAFKDLILIHAALLIVRAGILRAMYRVTDCAWVSAPYLKADSRAPEKSKLPSGVVRSFEIASNRCRLFVLEYFKSVFSGMHSNFISIAPSLFPH